MRSEMIENFITRGKFVNTVRKKHFDFSLSRKKSEWIRVKVQYVRWFQDMGQMTEKVQ